MNPGTGFSEKVLVTHSIPPSSCTQKVGKGPYHAKLGHVIPWNSCLWLPVLAIGWLASLPPMAMGGHQEHKAPAFEETNETPGHPVPGAPFQVFLAKGKGPAEGIVLRPAQANDAIHTVVDALGLMIQNRTHYQRFDEALTKGALQKIIIEPKVFNREGKEFPFLVARTKQKGKVKLLISALALDGKGYLNQPDKLVPVLAREFQWVLIKADTTPKPKTIFAQRDVKNAPIKTNKEIKDMSGAQREQAVLALFQTYLKTVDAHKSLQSQPFYEVGSATLTPPTQPDSTTKMYDIRVREALRVIMRDPYFVEHTPKAIRNLLNGKIWNVAFVKIDERDWATRTRVAPKDKAVTVGEKGRTVQPAKVLVNYHRSATPEDPFFSDTQGLPMGALSAGTLARVIAWEIEHNITEKSMRGHVAEDEASAPK